jgi:hypothetical protein
MKASTLVTLVGILSCAPQVVSGQTAAGGSESASVSQVWDRETEYWTYVKAGDVENYRTLWHERFIGWPCGSAHPLRKDAIGNWVQEIRDKHIKAAVDLTREGAEDFGDIVVVHYQFSRVDTFPDGHVEGKGEISKITHTWMRVGDTWLIIGGMCGGLPDSAK